MNVGIIGAGSIARALAYTMNNMDGINFYAVASRSFDRAESFAKEFSAQKAYGSYLELLADPCVDLVYIATPHSNHAEIAELALNYNKAVLCEKSFTMNSLQAEKIISLARKKSLFLTEALWTRYMPSRRIIDEVLESGMVGKVKALSANLSYNISRKERVIKAELAGGALLDVGIYALNFAVMHFGKDIERVESSAFMTDGGVDGMDSITIYYKDGRAAFLNAGIYARSDRKGIFYAEGGYIIVENINNPSKVSVYDLQDKLIKEIQMPGQITGYEYELLECEKCLSQGKTESNSMPLSESLYMMNQMDSLRKSWGMIYPQER